MPVSAIPSRCSFIRSSFNNVCLGRAFARPSDLSTCPAPQQMGAVGAGDSARPQAPV